MLDKTASDTTYRGGDGQTVFPIPFPFLENSHIEAELCGADRAAAVLAAGVDYIINSISDGNGELVLLGEALPAGAELIIRRKVPLTQEILFHNQGPNSPRATEEALDKLTMIAQQLQTAIDVSFETAGEGLKQERENVAELRAAVNNFGQTLAGKADAGHGHEVAAVAGLADRLAAKADALGVTAALAQKANLADLADKAGLVHKHSLTDVNALSDALGRKLDADDPRLAELAGARKHAASHAVNGTDPVAPEAIGVLPAPPVDGKAYLAAGGGWIEYVPPAAGGGEGGGTLDHFQLLNRDAADQHPQKAIQNLPKDLAEIRGVLTTLDGASREAALALATKADRGELPGIASQDESGLMSALDKRKLDILSAAGDGLPLGGGAGDVLARDWDGTPAWKTPAQLANNLPAMSSDRFGVAKISPSGGLKIDSSGHLGVSGVSLGAHSQSFTTDGTAVDFPVNHSLNTRDVLVQAFNVASGARAQFGVTVPDANRVILSASPARPAGETYRVVIASNVIMRVQPDVSDLEGYAKLADLDGYAELHYVNAELAKRAGIDDLAEYVKSAALNEYAGIAYVNGELAKRAKTSDLAAYAKLSALDTYAGLAYVNSELAGKAGTAVATPQKNGLMSSADKGKLDALSPGGSGGTGDLANYARLSDLEGYAALSYVDAELANKAGLATATPAGDGLMSATDKVKLDAMVAGGGEAVTVHGELLGRELPSQHPSSAISDNGESLSTVLTGFRGSMSALEDKLAGKASVAPATQTANGLMSLSDKSKLDGIAPGAVSAHGQLSGREQSAQHPSSAITDNGENLSDVLAGFRGNLSTFSGQLAGKASTALASQTADGLMAKADKSKLDAIASGAVSAHGQLSGRDQPSQHPSSAIVDNGESLASVLATFRTDLAAFVGQLAGKASTTVATQAADGLMSKADKTKLDALQSGGGGAGVPVGKIDLLPFRPDRLPSGWYFANGDTYTVGSAVGMALAALPAEYRADWRIASQGGLINLPNLFSGGDGLFLRPVNGLSRAVGSVQGDAMRKIYGETGGVSWLNKAPASGAFYRTDETVQNPNSGTNYPNVCAMDSSLVVPTDHETRPVNIGMTPAIYLGV